MPEVRVVNEIDIKQHSFSNVKVRDLLKTENPSISVAELNLSGENEKIKNTASDMIYYVVSGSGKFIINNQDYLVEKGSLIFIPKGSSYQDIGELKMLSLATPKFNPDDVVFLDNSEKR